MADLIIQNPSITTNVFEYDEVGRVSAISGHPLAGQGGGTIVKSDLMWKPSVESDGYVRWTLASSATTPEAAYISGAQGPAGPQGVSGNPGKNPLLQINPTNAHWEWKYSGDAGWTDLGIVASGAVGPQGLSGNSGKDGISPTVSTSVIPGGNRVTFTYGEGSSTYIDVMSGASGANGINGISPTVSTETIAGGNKVIFTYDNGGTTTTASIDVMSGVSGAKGSDGFSPTVELTPIQDSQYPQGGWNVTITDKDHQSGQTFQIFNGIDGQGATVDLIGGTGIQVSHQAGTTDYTISVSADYAMKSYVDSASAYALSQAETWVGNQHYLTSVPDTYALKSDVPTTVAQLTDSDDYAKKTDIPTVPTKVTDLTDSANYQTVAGMTDYLLTAIYAADSGKFVTSGSEISATNEQYALTTNGWAKIVTPATFTGVTTASPITGDGLNNPLGLDSNYKTAIEQVSGKVDKPADMTSNTPYCFSAGKWADMTQTYYSKTEATGTFLQKNLTNTLSGDGTKSNKLGVNWSNLSGNTITSALSAGSASYAVALGTTASYSALSDITGAINDAKFAGVSIADGSSITGNGLSTNKLGLVTSAENALIAVDNKLDKTAIVTATIDNTNYVTAVNINSTNIPIKGTSFWEVTAATGTTASNDTWQHYISTTNTFNYYKMVIHPYGTSSAQEWANDGIIHIILEA